MPKGHRGKRRCRIRTCWTGTRVVARGMCDTHYKRWQRKHILGFRERERYLRCRWAKTNRVYLRKLQRDESRRRLLRNKAACYEAYGGYRCACCGETVREFLTLDHVKGGGCKHIAKIGRRGGAIYRWIVKHNFPKGMFQVLCWNCNAGRELNGGICPHRRVQ